MSSWNKVNVVAAVAAAVVAAVAIVTDIFQPKIRCSLGIESCPTEGQTFPKEIVNPSPSSSISVPENPDYSKLENLLKQGKWESADRETAYIILKVAQRESYRYLDINSIGDFPCSEFKKIDQLWRQSSNNRFGFSVQSLIYHELGGKKQLDDPIWQKFGDIVGWRVGGTWLSYEELREKEKWLKYNELPLKPDETKLGTLPRLGAVWKDEPGVFLDRVKTCGL